MQDIKSFSALELTPEGVLVPAAKVFVAGHRGLVGSAILRRLKVLGCHNVFHLAWKHGVKKLLFLGSSCIYPRLAAQPIKEEYLLSGPLEPTNEAYAVAKIAGLKLAAAYRAQYGFSCISIMPTNLYGPGDNFDLQSSHVLPAMIRRFHEAKIAGAPS